MTASNNSYYYTVLAAAAVLFNNNKATAQNQNYPRLDGQKFRITVAEQPGFVNFDGGNIFSGYCIDMLEALARPDRANFTYELLTSSGYGEVCSPRLEKNDASSGDAYSDTYYSQFNCGQSDVNDVPRSDTSTDMYLSSYYVSPSRQLANQFTIPYSPPTSGTSAMFGTATGIKNFDDLVAKQDAGTQGPVGVAIGQAYVSFLRSIYPTLQVIEMNPGNMDPVYDALNDGTFDIFIQDYPIATQFVLKRSQKNQCLANGKPIGVIGDPLNYGLNYYAIGVGTHIPPETVNALSYWMNVLMVCNPADPEGECPDGNLYSFYPANAGSGEECGYVANPLTGSNLNAGAIAGIVVGCVVFVVLLGLVWHVVAQAKQRERYRKRLVQQISRNITIGPSASTLSAEKLVEELNCISKNGDGKITKEALKAWLDDDKLGSLSDSDFEALWSALSNKKNLVDPITFCAVLGTCGAEFESTYNEQQKMSKEEKILFASRRLSARNIET